MSHLWEFHILIAMEVCAAVVLENKMILISQLRAINLGWVFMGNQNARKSSYAVVNWSAYLVAAGRIESTRAKHGGTSSYYESSHM